MTEFSRVLIAATAAFFAGGINSVAGALPSEPGQIATAAISARG